MLLLVGQDLAHGVEPLAVEVAQVAGGRAEVQRARAPGRDPLAGLGGPGPDRTRQADRVGSALLLRDVGQLMSEEGLAAGRMRRVAPPREVDVLTEGEGLGLDLRGGLVGDGVGVDPNPAELAAQEGSEAVRQLARKRLARAARQEVVEARGDLPLPALGHGPGPGSRASEDQLAARLGPSHLPLGSRLSARVGELDPELLDQDLSASPRAASIRAARRSRARAASLLPAGESLRAGGGRGRQIERGRHVGAPWAQS